MMPLPIVHHADYDAVFAADHRFPMGKYSALMRALQSRGLAQEHCLLEPEPAAASMLELAHERAYVAVSYTHLTLPTILRV